MLIFANSNNGTVKLLDTETNTVVSQVKLHGDPWDLCLLPGDRAAVTLHWKGKIQFLSTKGKVPLQNIVKAGTECCEIDFCDDDLIVSFTNPGKVVLMDMKGMVKKSVDKYSSGKHSFVYPDYLTVIRESHTPCIFVSDWGTHTITMLSTSLQVLKTFQDAALTEPRGLTATWDNQLFVCNRASNNILYLDTSTGKMAQLLGEGEGIESPYSVAYCSLKKSLYGTCYPLPSKPGLNDCVKVFKAR